MPRESRRTRSDVLDAERSESESKSESESGSEFEWDANDGESDAGSASSDTWLEPPARLSFLTASSLESSEVWLSLAELLADLLSSELLPSECVLVLVLDRECDADLDLELRLRPVIFLLFHHHASETKSNFKDGIVFPVFPLLSLIYSEKPCNPHTSSKAP